jgi:MFS family permease
MAVLLNDLFFPPTDTQTQSLLAAFAFCSSFIFRPIGALLFGYIGDVYGRKVTVVITTFMMAITCLIMANAPTYSQVGITAAWIVTFCRILQGISSMGEITAAQLFLTEATPLPVRFPVVGLIIIFGELGALAAIAVAALATSYGFNWRIAFWIGAAVAIVGSVARTSLRESTEYADARKRLQSVADRAKENLASIKKKPFYNQPVNPKTSWSYFWIMCASPILLYFTYFYSANILRTKFGYTPHQVLVHNLIVGIIELFGWAILRTYLTKFIHPLRILRFSWIVLLIFAPFLPWLLEHMTTVWHLFFIQSFLVLFRVVDFPATPIFYKNFPVFKRFSYTSIIYALAYAFVYAITSFGLTYLINRYGYWGLLILMLPLLIGYGYGLHHFINLEKSAKRYPKMNTWDA